MPIREGATAMIPPPTPLLAGTPTRTAKSPEPSYIPQVIRMALTNRVYSTGMRTSCVPGRRPWLARTAPMRASPTQSVAMAQARK